LATILALARSALVGLRHAPRSFGPAWSWSAALDGLGHPHEGVRWCAAQCIGDLYALSPPLAQKIIEAALPDPAVATAWELDFFAFQAECEAKAAMVWAVATDNDHHHDMDQVNKLTTSHNIDDGDSDGDVRMDLLATSDDDDHDHGNGNGNGNDNASHFRDNVDIMMGRVYDPADDEGQRVPRGHIRLAGVDLSRAPPSRTHHPISSTSNESWASSSLSSPISLVATPSMEAALTSCVLALAQGRPLLVEGPPGSGKSQLIEHLASRVGASERMVRIHLDDQMDSKALLGAYACTARPGEFVWRPGPLTQAVRDGRWLLVEDLNLAPPEIVAALAPLLEQGELRLAQRAETLRAAPGFQLLASVTAAPRERLDSELELRPPCL
jgi:hypothetical protein